MKQCQISIGQHHLNMHVTGCRLRKLHAISCPPPLVTPITSCIQAIAAHLSIMISTGIYASNLHGLLRASQPASDVGSHTHPHTHTPASRDEIPNALPNAQAGRSVALRTCRYCSEFKLRLQRAHSIALMTWLQAVCPNQPLKYESGHRAGACGWLWSAAEDGTGAAGEGSW